MANAIRVGEITDATSPPWLREFASENNLNVIQRQAVFDVVCLCEDISKAGANWFVADFGLPNP
jgi:hypothetical protein